MPDDSSLILDTAQQVVAWTPRSYSADQVAVRQKLCGRGLVLKDTAFGFCPPPDIQPDAVWVKFTLNGAFAAVQTNWGTLRRFTGFPLEGLTPTDAALLVEEAATGWLEALEAQTGLAIRLTDVAGQSADATPGKIAPFEIGLSGGPHPLRLALSEQAALVLAKALPAAQSQLPDSFAIALRLELGVFELRGADLTGLRAGDALAWDSNSDHLRLLAQDSHSAGAKWSEAGLELTTAFGRIMQGEHLGMASELDAPKAEAMDDLDVRISVRAGEALMTLGDLKKLGPGSILPLAEPEADHVDLVVNGKRIGTGQLVTVGGTRAVEIKDLFGDG